MSRLVRCRFPRDIYNRCITFLYGSVDDINAFLKRSCGDLVDARDLAVNCRGRYRMVEQDGYQADFLCVVRVGDRDAEFAVLAHEALHLTVHALVTAGITLTADSEEAFTYYQQWLVEQALKAMRTRKRS